MYNIFLKYVNNTEIRIKNKNFYSSQLEEKIEAKIEEVHFFKEALQFFQKARFHLIWLHSVF